MARENMAQGQSFYAAPTREQEREELARELYVHAPQIAGDTPALRAGRAFISADEFLAERDAHREQRASEPLIDDARALALAESERNAARAERDALSDVLSAIHAELDGTEWESTTCQLIADRLREIGYLVRDIASEAQIGGAS